MKLTLAGLAVVLSLLLAPAMGEEAAVNGVVFDFVGKYCLECHDEAVEKGDRNYEEFELPLTTVADLVDAKDILDQVTLKEMPPKDAEQPTDADRLAMLSALRAGVVAARNTFDSTGGSTVIRRLSNREYENTLASLFGRRVDTLGLTADFPRDRTSQHIDTIGRSLVTSGFLLDQYFQAASRLVEARLGTPDTKPQDWHFTDHFLQYEELAGSHRSVFKNEFLCLYEQPNTDTRQGGYGHIEDFLEGVPVSGLYDIRIHAQAMHRFTHYDPTIFGIDFSEPFRVAIVPGDVTKGHIHYPQAIEPILAQAIVPDEKPEWLEFQVWLEAGQTPRFIFPNGPYESRASVLKVNDRYKDEFTKATKGVSRTMLLREGALPRIQIGEIKIHGPVAESDGSREEIAVFGPEGFQPDKAAEQLFAFGERAYRRPLNDDDRKRIRKTYEARLADKAPSRQAALDTLKMILCSPSFLYLAEITDENELILGPYDLASRLSYALWAGPPDEELFAAAGSGLLVKPEELIRQAKRLIADQRVVGFANGFLDSWLNLRDLGNQPPPRESNRSYYAEDLPTSMKSEARLFFLDLLESNGPVTHFLHSDYTFVDKKMAKLYDLPQAKALRLEDGFRRVKLDGASRRGGLFGMAAVLTVSANGVETSPVTRGVWVSENILGVEPPPPPDVVPEIESDVRGATSIREKLAKHSADKACSECHRKIDPLGFPLEIFDPIGRWRTSYPKPKGKEPAPKIDPSGEMVSGEKFANFGEFKKLLLQTRKDVFARHLIEEFLSYATGRHMEPIDKFMIDDIFAEVKKENYGFQSLIVECVSSEIFRSR